MMLIKENSLKVKKVSLHWASKQESDWVSKWMRKTECD
jgi:hypothetical protein